MLYDVHIVINSLKLYTMGPLPYSHCHFLQFYCSVTNALITLISFIQPTGVDMNYILLKISILKVP